jgi:hypothetical protein
MQDKTDAQIDENIKTWSTSNDPKMRKGCYGNRACEGVNDNDIVATNAPCISQLWAEKCSTARPSNLTFAPKTTKKQVTTSINGLTSKNDAVEQRMCYGTDETKWPRANDVDKCVKYNNNAKISSQCTKQLWKQVGCTTNLIPEQLKWAEDKNKNIISTTFNQIATSVKEQDRTICYTQDKNKWPKGLLGGQSLPNGGLLLSSNGLYKATFEKGKLCIKRTNDNIVLWCLNAPINVNSIFTLELNGNMNIKDFANKEIWKSGNPQKGQAPFTLEMGDDKVLALFDNKHMAVWSNVEGMIK